MKFTMSTNKGKEAGEWSLFDGGNMLLGGIATLIGGAVVKVGGFSMLIALMFGLQTIAAAVGWRLLQKEKKRIHTD